MNNSRGEFKGLIAHVNLVFDLSTKQPVGISNIQYIERKAESRSKKGEVRKRDTEGVEEKESYKWISGFAQTKERLKEAKSLMLVADREADIIELFDRIPDEKTNLVVRSQHDRNIKLPTGDRKKLSEVVNAYKIQGYRKIEVETKSRKRRTAKMEIRYGQVVLPWPKDKKVTEGQIHKKGIPVYIVDIKETKRGGFAKEKPLHWRIITTQEVETLDQAEQILKLYEQRWQIEEYFKLIKTDCFDIENTELTSGKAIRKLILYVMKVGIKIQQLKASRTGAKKIPISSVFDKEEIKCLQRISPSLEGNTEKQKNPYPQDELAYGAWVIARLGGWKEFYNIKRPPGTKTFVWGLEKFETIFFTFKLLDVS